MELAALTVVVLVCSAVAGDASLQGQWISQDSVFNGQNIFQIQQGSLFFRLANATCYTFIRTNH